MSIAILLLTISCLVAGIVLYLVTYLHRTEFGRTLPWYSPRYGFPHGGRNKSLTPTGFRLCITSYVLMSASLVLSIIAAVCSLPGL